MSSPEAQGTVTDTPPSAPEPATAVVSDAPVAAQEPPAAYAPAQRCENCGSPLMGPYCFQCGQRHGHSVRSVWHFTREATEDLTHADSRLWRTLYALLLRPGALTREYLDGHRVRYLPPMRLYLILSLLFFLIASLVPPTESIVRIVDTPAGTHIIREPTQGMVFHVPPAQIDPTCHKILQGMRPVWSTLGGREQPLMASCRKTFTDGGASLREAYLRNLPGTGLLLPYWTSNIVLRNAGSSLIFPAQAESQLRRAAASVPLNIAEGSGCASTAEFVHFLSYGYRSLKEVVTGLELCQRLYPSLPAQSLATLIDEGNQISRMTHNFIQKLNSNSGTTGTAERSPW